jgi:hypothetical protein
MSTLVWYSTALTASFATWVQQHDTNSANKMTRCDIIGNASIIPWMGQGHLGTGSSVPWDGPPRHHAPSVTQLRFITIFYTYPRAMTSWIVNSALCLLSIFSGIKPAPRRRRRLVPDNTEHHNMFSKRAPILSSKSLVSVYHWSPTAYTSDVWTFVDNKTYFQTWSPP